MNKTNIKSPSFHSNELYKFGLENQANQKYQCQSSGKLFSSLSLKVIDSQSELYHYWFYLILLLNNTSTWIMIISKSMKQSPVL